ncbi:MAG: hypothetical protein CVT67_05680 [Actinobacteria bacterium HGW-Actinobacteria-7]|nr:MAG: hypothetical protein CVT67_05680 [Actinobacteria bacterium HGW-Actinobacteria-7]
MNAHDEMLPPDDAVTDAPRRRRGSLIVSAIAIVVIGLLVLPMFSTLQPGYYARYPDLRVRVDHWRTSTHARMSCVDCHVEPGFKGFASFAIQSVPAFYSQLLGGPKRTNLFKPPSRRACQKCHTNYRLVSPDGDLLIPHRAHVVVLHINCVVCHKNLVHSENAKGFNRPEMATCFKTCHDGVTATNQCTKCHTRKEAPDNHLQPNWLAIHSQKSQTIDCGKCHGWTPDYCNDCHKRRPKSHTAGWRNDHQFPALKNGKGCLVCHGGEKFCKACH